MNVIVVFITAASRSEAERLAKAMVEQRLAACVQILPQIISFYHWQNAVQQNEEVLLLAKTNANQFAALEKVVRANHSYQVPEIIAVPASQVSAPYLLWLPENTRA